MRRLVFVLALVTMVGSLTDTAHAAQEHTGTIAWVPPCAIACSYWLGGGLEPCSNDFPPGTYGTVELPVAPHVDGKRPVGQVTIYPHIDWDAFICDARGNALTTGTSVLLGPCDGAFGSNSMVPIGCRDSISWVMEEGERYTLLAYNFSDDQDLPYDFTLIHI